MKRVLIVAYYFPPVAASGAMRPFGFCRFLQDYGWKANVLTTDAGSVYPPHHIDRQLSAKLCSSVTVNSVPYRNLLHRLIKLRGWIREATAGSMDRRSGLAHAEENNSPQHAQDVSPLSRIKNFVADWAFAFPDIQSAWLRPAVRFCDAIPPNEYPDIVFATGGPWTNLVIGKRLAERFGVPLVVDYRDPWTSNPYISFASSILNGRAKQLEREVCSFAKRVITNTNELREELCRDYPQLLGKSLTITNGFDPEAFGSGPSICVGDHADAQPSAGKDMIELSHFGTVYGKRNPAILLQGLHELAKAGVVTGDKLCVKFVGTWDVTDTNCEQLAKDLEMEGLIKREPPVSHHICLQKMARADGLLVIQPESPLQIPGKIYEYIATRAPMILIGGEGATANLVERYQLGIRCPNTVDAVKTLLQRIIKNELILKAPSAESVQRFDYRRLTGELAQTLEQVCVEHVRR